MTELQNVLEVCVPGGVRVNEPMSGHTSFKIGGPADILVTPANTKQLQQVIKVIKVAQVPLLVLGNGSNVLVRDKGIRGVVVKLGNVLREFKQNGDELIFGAGYSLALAAKMALECGRTGMEFAVGIPGSIGGAVYMNAGAYDGEMCNVVTRIRAIDGMGQEIELTAEELTFAYRKTSLQSSGLIVTEVVLKMPRGNMSEIKAKMDDFSNRRLCKQPLEMPSAGSMFRRPPGYFAGTLIDEAGLKGYKVGGAQISPKHAGFVINTGNATATDVLQLIGDVQKIVREQSGIELQPEVLVLGEE